MTTRQLPSGVWSRVMPAWRKHSTCRRTVQRSHTKPSSSPAWLGKEVRWHLHLPICVILFSSHTREVSPSFKRCTKTVDGQQSTRPTPRPLSSEQILHPEKYLELPDPPLEVQIPEYPEELAGWTLVRDNVLGEVDFLSWFRTFLPDADAGFSRCGMGWLPLPAVAKGSQSIFILNSRWDSADDAWEAQYALEMWLKYRFQQAPESISRRVVQLLAGSSCPLPGSLYLATGDEPRQRISARPAQELTLKRATARNPGVLASHSSGRLARKRGASASKGRVFQPACSTPGPDKPVVPPPGKGRESRGG